eukprot:TRINITY_DN1063_c0_g1_i1.p1 TRINITY_DN1063_c0_g1~~TRINITY_DN1063_c0_g1_i1.p1  ORF type:complete len:298 (-),score=41.74 TRINITY_DN1063_c0_g1_i1:57-950(-)
MALCKENVSSLMFTSNISVRYNRSVKKNIGSRPKTVLLVPRGKVEPHTYDIKIKETPLNTMDAIKMRCKQTKTTLGTGATAISYYISEPVKNVMGIRTVQTSVAVGVGTEVLAPIVGVMRYTPTIISYYTPERVKKVMGNRTVQISVAVGVGAVVLAPIVIPTVVGMLGFSTTGIIYGTAAAKLMAITGPVGSGGLVAVCQSIGATGLISTTTAVAAGVAAAGTTAVGATGKSLLSGSDDKGTPVIPEETSKESKGVFETLKGGVWNYSKGKDTPGLMGNERKSMFETLKAFGCTEI